MAFVFKNMQYDEEFSYQKGDALGSNGLTRTTVKLNKTRDICMRWILTGVWTGTEAQYYGADSIYIVDFFIGTDSNVNTRAVLRPENITNQTLKERFIELFGNNPVSILITLGPTTSDYCTQQSANVYYGRNVAYTETYNFIASSDIDGKFLYISPKAMNLLKYGSSNINDNYASNINITTPVVQYSKYYSYIINESGNTLAQIPGTNLYDYRANDINSTHVMGFMTNFLSQTDENLKNMNYYDNDKRLLQVTYDVTLNLNSGIATFDITMPDDGIPTFGQEYTIMSSDHGNNGVSTTYKVFIEPCYFPSKEEVNGEIPLWDNEDINEKRKRVTLPIAIGLNNTGAYQNYIDNPDQSGIYGYFFYNIYFKSYKYTYKNKNHPSNNSTDPTIPLTGYEYTLDYNGGTRGIDNCGYNIAIPLKFSANNESENIYEHIQQGIKEVLIVHYNYTEPTYEQDINDPNYYIGEPSENQEPTPTEPEFTTDKPTVVTPTNKPDHPDIPLGSIVDPMKPQAITPTTNPLMNVQGLYTIYKLDLLDLVNLGSFLWGSAWYENLRLINNTPLENILSLKIAPFNLETAKTTQVYIGNVPAQVGETIISGDVIERNLVINVGTFTIKPKYNSFLDLQPFTNIQVYLPFVGFTQLDNNLVLNVECSVIAYIDALTIMGKYQIMRSDNILVGEWEFNPAVELPLSATNKAQAEFSKFSTMAKTIGNVVGDVVSMDVGKGISDAVSGITSAISTQYHTSTTGNMTSNLSLMTSRQCYIQITRPMWQDIQLFNHTYGRMCNMTLQIGTLKGFTQILDIDLSGINATEEEKEMIKSIMASGFYA